MTRRRLSSPLPVRDGVCASRVFLPDGPWRTLLEFLQERYPHLHPDVLEARLVRGDIVDTQGRAQTIHTPYQANQWLWYYREVPHEQPVPFDLPVLYASNGLVVADKPHFLASTPGGRYLKETALIRLRRRLELPELSPLHRLDRDTAGIILFCTDPARRGAYQSLFQRREVHKVYEAIAPWRADLRLPHTRASAIAPSGVGFCMIETPGTPNSETRIELISRLPNGYAHYRLVPVTGRKHQLRVHMSVLGVPIMHDEMYPCVQPLRQDADFSRPLQLLARMISFTDPFTGQLRRFESQRRLAMLEPPLVDAVDCQSVSATRSDVQREARSLYQSVS